MRNITLSGSILSRIVGILPLVCVFTQPLIADSDASTLAKSSGLMVAPK